MPYGCAPEAEMAASSLAVGKKAPDFALDNQNDETIRLRDLNGSWVVLYFYPKDDTPGCTVEACDFTSGLKGFEKLNATVLGCSPDSTESHRRFIAKHKLKIDLLSDPERETLLKYGAWGEKQMYGRVTQGVLRSTVIIDPAGKVAHHWPKVSAQGHAAAVREKLKELQSESEK
jgi:thioredoxin-dependent peroxiredoxin